MDSRETSWVGSTRMSTESLPSKALSMSSGAVLAPVGDSEPLDRSISQPNIAGGGLKLPATVPPSPTVLASCSSTSSDLSRGGYVSADSLGSMSSKDDMLSAPLTNDETLSLTTERSTRSASPCHENVPSVSVTVEEEPVRSSSLTASLEPTPDLVLNLPTSTTTTTSESAIAVTTGTHAVSPTLTTSAAEMFASAEHGTIKKSATLGRSSVSGEEGTGVDEVFPHTPVEITHALDGGDDSFNFDLLPAPPPALTDVPFPSMMQSTDGELPQLDDLPDYPLECKSTSQGGPSASSLGLPITSTGDISCEKSAAIFESQSQVSSVINTESVTDVPEESSSVTTDDDRSLESKSTDLIVSHSSEPSVSKVRSVEAASKLAAEVDFVVQLQLPAQESLDLSPKGVSSESTTDVTASAAEVKSQSASPVVTAVDLCAASSSGVDCQVVETSEIQPVAVVAALPFNADDAAVMPSETPDVMAHLSAVTSYTDSSSMQADPQFTTSPASPTELRPVASMSPRPSSIPTCTVPSSVTVLPQPHLELAEDGGHPVVARRASESAVSTSPTSPMLPPQSAISHLVLSTHRQLAASVAATSGFSAVTSGFPEPLPHRPPPSLAAHTAALQLLTEKQHEPPTATATETMAKTEQSPSDRPKTKPPPPVKKKPTGSKFFPAASGDHH